MLLVNLAGLWFYVLVLQLKCVLECFAAICAVGGCNRQQGHYGAFLI